MMKNLNSVLVLCVCVSLVPVKFMSTSNLWIISCPSGLKSLNSDGHLEDLGNHAVTELFGKCQNDIFWPDKDKHIIYKGRISDDDKEIVLRYDDNASYIKDFIVDCPNKRLYILNGKMNSLELFQLGTKAPITLLVNLDGIQRIAMDTSHLVIYFLYLNHIEFFTLKDQRRKKLNCACIHRPTAVAIDNDDIYVAEEDRGILKVSSDSLNCTLILNHTGFIPNVAVADNSLTIIDSLHDRVVEMARDTLTIISNTSVTQPRDIHPSSAQRLTLNSILPALLMFYYIFS